MDSRTAPSGGSASDDWTIQGRTRGKARGSTRAGALADSAPRKRRWSLVLYLYLYTTRHPNSIPASALR